MKEKKKKEENRCQMSASSRRNKCEGETGRTEIMKGKKKHTKEETLRDVGTKKDSDAVSMDDVTCWWMHAEESTL